MPSDSWSGTWAPSPPARKPGSLELFRRVLLASASIPVAFPPVYFEVEVDGKRYDEMHVDGGVMAEFFLWGAMVNIADARSQLLSNGDQPSPASIYIIRNSQIDAAPKQVSPTLTAIASRSMVTLLKAVAMGDLIRIWTLAERDGVDFNYIGIPPEHAETPAGTFEPPDMRRLFELGRAMALEPYPWRKEPPTWVRSRQPFVIPSGGTLPCHPERAHPPLSSRASAASRGIWGFWRNAPLPFPQIPPLAHFVQSVGMTSETCLIFFKIAKIESPGSISS